MKRAFIQFFVVMLAALSLSSLSKADDNDVEHHEKQRILFSGERNKVNFAYQIAGDCSMYALPSVQILNPPQHGKMEPVREEGYPSGEDEYEKCNTTKVLGLAAYYTPDEGFTGTDSVTARFSYGDGYVVETVFYIQIIEKPKLDPTCDAVNRAYVATHSSPHYKEKIYELNEDGTRDLFSVVRGDPEKLFGLNLQTGRWTAHDKHAAVRLEDREYPKFSSCRLLDRQRTPEGKVAHYSAIWRKFPYTAEAEIWISADTGLSLRTLRRYPDNGRQFPFGTALSVFDYNPIGDFPHARADDRPKEDPTCRAVNYAYVATLGTWSYSKKIYNLKKDGTRKPYADIRVTRAAEYLKYAFGERWVEFDRSAWSTFDRFGPKFTACKRIKGGKEIRYRATWHDFPFEASAEIWISAKDKRFIKVIRRYSDRWEYSFPVALEVFDYDPKNAVAPTQ